MTLFFAIYTPKIGGGGLPLPDVSAKKSKPLRLGPSLVSNSTQNVHKFEQNARTKDTYPHGNATKRLSTWYNVCSIMVPSLYVGV